MESSRQEDVQSAGIIDTAGQAVKSERKAKSHPIPFRIEITSYFYVILVATSYSQFNLFIYSIKLIYCPMLHKVSIKNAHSRYLPSP